MLTQLQGHQLPAWIEAATTAELPSLQRFARHLERDLDPVITGLSQPWNSGVVEGHVNRIRQAQAAYGALLTGALPADPGPEDDDKPWMPRVFVPAGIAAFGSLVLAVMTGADSAVFVPLVVVVFFLTSIMAAAVTRNLARLFQFMPWFGQGPGSGVPYRAVGRWHRAQGPVWDGAR
ncbi:hypothetical protein [Streptomyces sp. NPDC048349]|uniref:hypothetical protein n=1 Tax=Streptomyces sp. NPDC048349 TaxID=3155486 RepID=UPI00343622D1